MIPCSAPGPTPAPVWLAYPRNTNDPVVDPDVGKIIVRGIDPEKPNSPTISIFPSPLPMGTPQIATSPFPSPFATSPPWYGSTPYLTISLPKLRPGQMVIVVAKQRVWANNPPSCTEPYVQRVGAFVTRAKERALYRVLDVGTPAAPHLDSKQLEWLVKVVENGSWDKRLDHLWYSTLVDERPLTVIDDAGYDFSKPANWEPVYPIIGENCGLKFARNENLDAFFVGPPETSCTNDLLYEGRSGGGPRSAASKALLSRLRALLAKTQNPK